MQNEIPRAQGVSGATPPEVVAVLCSRFLEAGVMLFDDVLPADRVSRLHSAYSEIYERYHRDVAHADARRVGDARHMITVGVTGVFNDPMVYANPSVLPVVLGLLGEDAILGSFVAVTSLPGSDDQSLHIDTPPLFAGAANMADLPPHCLTLVVPLVDMNAANGTTAFLVGREAMIADGPPKVEPVRPVVPTGSAVLFDSRVWHFGTANRSKSPRPVLYNSYHRPWFRDSVNFGQQHPLEIPDDEFARVPDAYRHLFRWARHSGA